MRETQIGTELEPICFEDKNTPRNRIVVAGMRRRWIKDLRRLEIMFGPYNAADFGPEPDMMRNLGTAIAEAEFFLARKAVPHRSPMSNPQADRG